MRSMQCFEAVSAGLFLDGDVAVLSFLTNDMINHSEASVVMTREMLHSLQVSMATALRANDLRLPIDLARERRNARTRLKRRVDRASLDSNSPHS